MSETTEIDCAKQEGSQLARDAIIASIIGMQNRSDIPWNSDECEHYQNVLNMIEETYGAMFQSFKV